MFSELQWKCKTPHIFRRLARSFVVLTDESHSALQLQMLERALMVFATLAVLQLIAFSLPDLDHSWFGLGPDLGWTWAGPVLDLGWISVVLGLDLCCTWARLMLDLDW